MGSILINFLNEVEIDGSMCMSQWIPPGCDQTLPSDVDSPDLVTFEG